MFLCPECQVRLARALVEGALVWTCPSCGGHAIGLAILRKVVAPAQIHKLWLDSEKAGAGRRQCPSCQQRMREVPLGHDPELFKLDVCRGCQFVWFDPQELEAVPLAPTVPVPKKASDSLPQAAREALAIYEAERIGEQAHSAAPEEWWKYVPALLGLPAECDNPVKHFPWFTCSLAILVTFFSILAFGNLYDAAHDYGLVPSEPWRQAGLTLLTSFFIHGSLLHLAGNMYFLLVFGDNVEDVLGKQRFVLLLLLSIVAAGIVQVLWAPDSRVPYVGASGGISALIVFYVLQFPRARLSWLSRYAKGFWIQVPAWFALVLWLIYQLLMLGFRRRGVANISIAAQLGGAAVGFVFWLILRPKSDESKCLPEEII